MGIKMKIEMQSPQRTKVELGREIPDLVSEPRFRLLCAEASQLGLSRGHTSSSGALEAVTRRLQLGGWCKFYEIRQVNTLTWAHRKEIISFERFLN